MKRIQCLVCAAVLMATISSTAFAGSITTLKTNKSGSITTLKTGSITTLRTGSITTLRTGSITTLSDQNPARQGIDRFSFSGIVLEAFSMFFAMPW